MSTRKLNFFTKWVLGWVGGVVVVVVFGVLFCWVFICLVFFFFLGRKSGHFADGSSSDCGLQRGKPDQASSPLNLSMSQFPYL